jgi:Fe-S cluster assembly ATP-binding protein
VISLSALRIEDLCVEVFGKRVLNGVDLDIPKGETHVLFGPNGSGKTSLIMAILGFSNYRIVSGRILLNDMDITDLPINERVKLGLGVTFQNPPAIRGVKLGDIVRSFTGKGVETNELTETMKLPREFLDRDLNLGFSGGELKRSEILQVLAQKPYFLMLDEPDSGVDVENLELIGQVVNKFLRGRSGLLITHLGYVLRYVDTQMAHVLINGLIACSGKPVEILGQILSEGYKWCEKCPVVKKKRCVQRISQRP